MDLLGDTAMTCARCQKELEDGSAFCRFCGAAVGAVPRARRIARIPEEGQIAGVCAGLASYLDADVTLIRLAWIILSIVPGLLFGGVIAYVACWILLPIATPEERHVYRGPRLTRSAADRQLAGVCGGLAEYLGVDPTIVRVVCVILAIYPGAIIGGVIAYLIGWIVIPANQAPASAGTTPRNAESLP
jgi:phage shock protein PspC (stress-responsive transcriptional regulator)